MAKQNVSVFLFYNGDFQDVTSDVYTRDEITITRGRGPESPTTPPSRATLTFADADKYNPSNPESELFGLIGRGTLLVVQVGGATRFYGEVVSWTPRRAIKGDSWVLVEATGATHRLGQGTDPLGSALRRYLINATTVVGYWPLENLPTEGTARIPAAVGPAATIRSTGSSIIAPMKFSAETNLIGSGALPTLDTERGLAGVEANITVDANPALGAMFWTRTAVPAKSGSNDIFTQATLTLFLRDDAGTIPRYHLSALMFPPGSTIDTEDTVTVRAGTANGSGAGIDTVEATGEAFVDGWRFVYARFSQDGSDVDVSVRLDGAEVATGTLTSVTLDQVTGMRMGVFTDGGTSDQVDPISVGHPVIAAGSTAALDSLADDVYDAGRGWPGELAEDRFTRLHLEEGLPSSVVGDGDETQPMGPQRSHTFMELMAEIERTDGGFIYDDIDANTLVMRTGRSLYNQAPALELTYGTDVGPPLDPVLDDKTIRNDVTASSPSGGSARASLDTGTLSTAAPPSGIGRRPARADVNPMSDVDLANHARWRLHLGTVDGPRYPQISVILTDAGSTLITAVNGVDIGDLITIDDLLADTVRLLVPGYTEIIGSHSRRITFNTVPAEPYQIAEVEHDDYSVIGNGDSWVDTEFVAGTDTQLLVTTAEGHQTWSDVDAPFDVVVSGVRLTVVAVTDDGSSPGVGVFQTLAVNQTPVNGVEKVIAEGADASPTGPAVDVFHKSYIGL